MTNKIKYLQQIRVLAVSCLVALFLSSCASIPPNPTQLEYFQDVENDTIFPVQIKTIDPPVSRIQKGDVLGIIVTSLSKESNEVLNFYNASSLPQTTYTPGGTGGSQLIGYPIDSSGYISMPYIGKQKLTGLTLQQAEVKLESEIAKTIKGPAVNVRFINHKFTVIGEVGRGGTFNLSNDQTTIIDAITAAGDLGIFAKRDSIKIIRTENGRREMGIVSLRTREVFTSPYYYIKHEDIIYVEPTKYKLVPTPQKIPVSQRITLYLSVLTTALSTYLAFSRL
ncbi:hypothetical protein GCM10028805_60890 [Spirosoma harenae]